MPRSLAMTIVVAALACAPAEKKEADTPAAAPVVQPAALDLASLAGKWTQVARAENSDSVLVTTELTAGADASSWTILMPGRTKPEPVRVTVDGDSIMTQTGPYESVLRKGQMVTTTGVSRLVDGKMVGITIARYAGGGPDSILRLRTEATRHP